MLTVSALFFVVARRTDTDVGPILPQLFDGLLVADAAVVRMVKAPFDPIQHDAKTALLQCILRQVEWNSYITGTACRLKPDDKP